MDTKETPLATRESRLQARVRCKFLHRRFPPEPPEVSFDPIPNPARFDLKSARPENNFVDRQQVFPATERPFRSVIAIRYPPRIYTSHEGRAGVVVVVGSPARGARVEARGSAFGIQEAACSKKKRNVIGRGGRRSFSPHRRGGSSHRGLKGPEEGLWSNPRARLILLSLEEAKCS